MLYRCLHSFRNGDNLGRKRGKKTDKEENMYIQTERERGANRNRKAKGQKDKEAIRGR
jgi:hypothetical protein